LNFAPDKIPLRGNSCRKSIHSLPAQIMATHYAVWLASVERRRCSNEAKTRKPLKLAGMPQTNKTISTVSGPKFTILQGHVGEILLLNTFFPIVDTCLSCEDVARQSCVMVHRWQFFVSCIFSEPRTAHFRHAF